MKSKKKEENDSDDDYVKEKEIDSDDDDYDEGEIEDSTKIIKMVLKYIDYKYYNKFLEFIIRDSCGLAIKNDYKVESCNYFISELNALLKKTLKEANHGRKKHTFTGKDERYSKKEWHEIIGDKLLYIVNRLLEKYIIDENYAYELRDFMALYNKIYNSYTNILQRRNDISENKKNQLKTLFKYGKEEKKIINKMNILKEKLQNNQSNMNRSRYLLNQFKNDESMIDNINSEIDKIKKSQIGKFMIKFLSKKLKMNKIKKL